MNYISDKIRHARFDCCPPVFLTLPAMAPAYISSCDIQRCIGKYNREHTSVRFTLLLILELPTKQSHFNAYCMDARVPNDDVY